MRVRGARTRWVAAATIGALAALGATVLPAAAAPSGAGPGETVTVYLQSPNATALNALAGNHLLPRSAKLQQLARLVPQAPTRSTVADRLRGLGLTVTGEDTWSVTATAPAATVRRLFGSARSVRATTRVGQGLPTVPAALHGLVGSAVGGDETRPAWHRLVTPAAAGLSPQQARAAYGATVPTGPVPTVATLQLSGWNPNDLATYASAAGVANPLTNGHYQAVNVGRTQTYTTDDGDGDVEVALDQEAILAAEPTAKELAYFAPNTLDSVLDVLQRVGNDARAPGASIVSFSSSWGACEADSSATVLNTAQQLLAAAAAAGVTLFGSSGDDGSDDCGNGGTGVDFPASAPSMVAVGGTSLHATAGGWSETAWDGSGGGCSAVFAKPAYQGTTPCGGARAVPDISAVADPGTGLAVEQARVGRAYAGSPGKWVTVGGTSLSAPLSAGLLAGAWSRSGGNGRYGDIHAALYAAPASTFRDVVSGSNGAYSAGPGYDLVTGRGSPNWGTLGTALTLTNPLPAGPVLAGVAATKAVYVSGASASGLRNLGGVGSTPPNVVRVGTHALYVVGGSDRNVWATNGDTPWTSVGPAGTACLGQAATAVGSTLWVGCRGSDGQLWVGSAPLGNGPTAGRVGHWTAYGGKLNGPPAVATPGGVVTWYVTGTNPSGSNLYARTASSGWAAAAVRCGGAPGASTLGSVTYVGCLTSARAVVYRAANGAFVSAGGTAIGSPGFAVASDGTARIGVIGTNGVLYSRGVRATAPGATGWASLGGKFSYGTGAGTIG